MENEREREKHAAEASRSFCVCVCVYWCVCTSVCVSVHISRSFSAIWPFLYGQNTHTKAFFVEFHHAFFHSHSHSWRFRQVSTNSVSINWLIIICFKCFKKYHFNNFSNMATLERRKNCPNRIFQSSLQWRHMAILSGQSTNLVYCLFLILLVKNTHINILKH
jgi:hypothetical protein